MKKIKAHKICIALSLFVISLLFVNINYSQDLTPTKVEKLKLFDTEFVVNTYEVARKPNYKDVLTYLVIHHNEQTGLNVVKNTIKERGGKLVELVSILDEAPNRYLHFQYDEQRFRIDPNRIFSKEGIEAKLEKYQCEEIEKSGRQDCVSDWKGEVTRSEYDVIVPNINEFAQKFVGFVKTENNNKILVAVHNSTNGGYDLRSYLHRGSESISTDRGLFFAEEDKDNFLLVTNEDLFDKLINYYGKNWRYNIAIQKAPPIPVNGGTNYEGSLSILFGRNNWNYITVEAQHRKGKNRQKEMINTLIEVFENK